MARQQSDLRNNAVFAITLVWLYVWETIERREHIFARTQFLHVGVVVVACLFLTLTVPMYLRYSKPLLRNSVADYILPPDALEWRKQLTQIIYDKAYASNALVSLWIFLVVNIWISFIPRSWWSYELPPLTVLNGIDEDTRKLILASGGNDGAATAADVSVAALDLNANGGSRADVYMTGAAIVFGFAVFCFRRSRAYFFMVMSMVWRLPSWVKIIGAFAFFYWKPHLLVYTWATLFLIYTDVVSRVMDSNEYIGSNEARFLCARLLEYATGVSYVIAGLDEAGYTLSDLLFDDWWNMFRVLAALGLYGHAIMFVSKALTEFAAYAEQSASARKASRAMKTKRRKSGGSARFQKGAASVSGVNDLLATFVYPYSMQWRIGLSLIWSAWSVVSGRSLARRIIEWKPLTNPNSEIASVRFGPMFCFFGFCFFFGFFLYFVALYTQLFQSVLDKTQILKCKPDWTSAKLDETSDAKRITYSLGPLSDSFASLLDLKECAPAISSIKEVMDNMNIQGEQLKWVMFITYITTIYERLASLLTDLASLKERKTILDDPKPWKIEFYAKLNIENASAKRVVWEETEVDISCDGGASMTDAQWGDLDFEERGAVVGGGVHGSRDADAAAASGGETRSRHKKALMACVAFTKGDLNDDGDDEGAASDEGAFSEENESAEENGATKQARSWILNPNSNDEHHVKVRIEIPRAAKQRWIELLQSVFASDGRAKRGASSGGRGSGGAKSVEKTAGRKKASGGFLSKIMHSIVAVTKSAVDLTKSAVDLRTSLTRMRAHFINVSDSVSLKLDQMDPRWDVAVALKLDNEHGNHLIPEKWLPHVSLPVVVDNRGGFAEERDDVGGKRSSSAKTSTEGTMFSSSSSSSSSSGGNGSSSCEDTIDVEEMWVDFFNKLERDGDGGGRRGRGGGGGASATKDGGSSGSQRQDAVGIAKKLLKAIKDEEATDARNGGLSKIMTLCFQLLARFTSRAPSGDQNENEVCDLFTEMTASFFLYEVLEAVKDAFAFQSFRGRAVQTDHDLIGRWNSLTRPMKLRHFQDDKGWNKLWFGRFKGVVLQLWKSKLALDTRGNMKKHVRDLWSGVREKFTPTLDGWLRASKINVHNVQFGDGSVGELAPIFDKLGVVDYDDLWKIEAEDLIHEGVSYVWAEEKLIAVRPDRKPAFSSKVVNAETWQELLTALRLDGADTASGDALRALSYDKLRKMAAKEVEAHGVKDSAAEVTVLMRIPYGLKLVQARKLIDAASKNPHCTAQVDDIIANAASATDKESFLRALGLSDFNQQIGYSNTNVLLTMDTYTCVCVCVSRSALLHSFFSAHCFSHPLPPLAHACLLFSLPLLCFPTFQCFVLRRRRRAALQLPETGRVRETSRWLSGVALAPGRPRGAHRRRFLQSTDTALELHCDACVGFGVQHAASNADV